MFESRGNCVCWAILVVAVDSVSVTEVGSGSSRRLIGLLLRADVMRRYRQEMLEVR